MAEQKKIDWDAELQAAFHPIEVAMEGAVRGLVPWRYDGVWLIFFADDMFERETFNAQAEYEEMRRFLAERGIRELRVAEESGLEWMILVETADIARIEEHLWPPGHSPVQRALSRRETKEWVQAHPPARVHATTGKTAGRESTKRINSSALIASLPDEAQDEVDTVIYAVCDMVSKVEETVSDCICSIDEGLDLPPRVKQELDTRLAIALAAIEGARVALLESHESRVKRFAIALAAIEGAREAPFESHESHVE